MFIEAIATLWIILSSLTPMSTADLRDSADHGPIAHEQLRNWDGMPLEGHLTFPHH